MILISTTRRGMRPWRDSRFVKGSTGSHGVGPEAEEDSRIPEAVAKNARLAGLGNFLDFIAVAWTGSGALCTLQLHLLFSLSLFLLFSLSISTLLLLPRSKQWCIRARAIALDAFWCPSNVFTTEGKSHEYLPRVEFNDISLQDPLVHPDDSFLFG